MILGICFNLSAFFLELAVPVYRSLKAMNMKNEEEATQWLSYWVVFGFAYGLEQAAYGWFSIIPYYHFCKFLFVVWLVTPWFKGSVLLYDQFVAPFLTEHEERIDTIIDDITSSAEEMLSPTTPTKNPFE